MFRPIVVLLLLSATNSLAHPAAGAEPAAKADPARVARLIEQLGSERFLEREAANQALDAIGPAALEALRGATANPDGEIARRARDLVEQLERRLRTARALEGPRVHLMYRDTPVAEAVADFARKTGYPLQIDEQEKARLTQRKVTLDTGDVSFWEALDQLCDRAGLIEKQPAPGQQPNATDPYSEYLGKQIRSRREFYPGIGTEGRSSGMILAEGKRPALPTSLAGALRLQAKVSKRAVQGIGPQEGEALLEVEMSVAPGLEWLGLFSLRVHRAVDDRGQALTQPGAYLGPEMPLGEDLAERLLIMELKAMEGYQAPAGQRHQFPIRLKLAPQPSRVVRELHGTLAGAVLTRPVPLVTVDDVFQAAGRSVKGDDGGSVMVIEAKEDQRRLTLKLQVEAPPDDTGLLAGGAWADLNQRRFALQALRVNNANQVSSPLAQHLALHNAQGEAIPPEECRSIPGGNANVSTVQVTFLLRPGQEKPTRLVYTDRRRVVVEVPFTLKDVPLP